MGIGSDIKTTFYESSPREVKQFYFGYLVEVTILRLVLLSSFFFMFRPSCIPEKNI